MSPFSVYLPAVKMQATCTKETYINIYKSVDRQIPILQYPL